MNLIERELELTTLRSLFAESLDGHGKVVVVGGTVASGKSALLHSLAEHAAAAGAVYLGATASHAEQRSPLGVVRQLFRGVELPPGREDARRLLDEQIGTAAFAGGEFQPETTAQTTWPVLQELCRVLLGMAARTPLVIGLDDVHHADAASLSFLSYAAYRLRAAPIVMVLTERIGPRREHPWFHADLQSQPHYWRLRVKPLSRRGQIQLLKTRLAPRQAHEFAPVCDAVTGGNPALVQALLQDERVPPQDGPVRDAADLAVGDAFPRVALHCLHRGGPEMHRVARALAVLREPCPPVLVGALLGLDAEYVSDMIDTMDAAGLLDAGRFRHPAVPAAVLEGMTAEERAVLHERAARLLHDRGAAPRTVAEHLIAAAEAAGRPAAPTDPDATGPAQKDLHPADEESWKVPVLVEAAEQARTDGAAHTALVCLRLARENCADDRRRAEITMAMARVEWLVDPGSVERLLPGLVDAVRAKRLNGRHAARLPGYLMWHGRPGEAAEVLGPLTGRAEAPLDWSACFLTATRLLLSCVYPGYAEAADGAAADRPAARHVVPGLENRRLRAAAALREVLTGRTDLDVPGTAEQFMQGTRLTETSPGAVLAVLAALIYDDHPHTAARWCDPLLEEAAARHEPLWHATLAAARALICVRQGDLTAAADHARTALARISPASWGVAIGVPIAASVYATTAMGRYEDAATHLGIAVPDAMFDTLGGLHYLRARGRFHLATGHPEIALADFEACGERMRDWRIDVPGLVPWRTDAAQALLELGETDRAAELADEQLAMARHRTGRTLGVSLRVRALAAADPRRRGELLEEAVRVLERCDDRYELSLARCELSRARKALGEAPKRKSAAKTETAPKAAPEPKKAQGAARVPAHNKMLPLTTPARDTIAAPADPAAGLTDAERRVAALVVQGRTNRQIADTLLVTISTVEQHLTRIYRKLGVTRRADLVRRLRAGPPGCPQASAPAGAAEPPGTAAAGPRRRDDQITSRGGT
ncbi:transcriptional regulator [Actinomadura sp. NBRC 104425]|uniref:helix-turn-helix transcriptional regulator n=1 Tax=Actinomadura sp. NBRC 104425 TaxID=3032204 RepID=UPI0024A2820D|nr:AAA family ATPase [Actinomadura sp. NBRC 104425]GLZ14343.1 transcriptional regulator [Actinomadura sp. NBRC 104425]